MNLANYLKKESSNLGYTREKFEEKRIPENPKDIVVIPFFGDIRSLSIFATVIFNRLIEDKTKYYIVCSWHGFKDLFPEADEYWSIKNNNLSDKICNNAGYFSNDSNFIASNNRNLSYKFENVITNIDSFYDRGFTELFWEKFKTVKISLPQVDSITKLDKFTSQMLQQNKKRIFISPMKKINIWHEEKLGSFNINKEFWIDTIRYLCSYFNVLVWQNCFTYDISPYLAETCCYLNNVEIDQVLIGMNNCLTVDIFSGLSKLALLARSPFVSVDERIRFFTQKDNLLDACTLPELNKQYIFSNGRMVLGGTIQSWRNAFLDVLVKKINQSLDLPSNLGLNREMKDVDLDFKEQCVKRLGLHFIKKY